MSEYFYTQEPWMVFVNLLLLFLLYVLFEPSLKGIKISPSSRITGLIIIILFCLFSFWGTDWFHYLDVFNKHKSQSYLYTHLEDVYIWIISHVPNYITFRLVIWGISILLLNDSINRLGLNKDLAWLTFIVISLIWFSYARVSLAMCLMFWGVSLLYEGGKHFSILRYLIGIASIVASYYFHKSAVYGIGVIALSMIMMSFNRKAFIFSIIILPVLVYITRLYIVDFILIDFTGDESEFDSYMGTAQRYLRDTRSVRGIASIIQQILEKAPYYLTAILCVKLQNLKQYKTIPKGIRIFINITLLIVVTSTVFAFDLGINTRILYTRFMRFGFIPIVFIITYCLDNNHFLKLSKTVFFVGLISTLYCVTYSLYNAILH